MRRSMEMCNSDEGSKDCGLLTTYRAKSRGVAWPGTVCILANVSFLVLADIIRSKYDFYFYFGGFIIVKQGTLYICTASV
jgi:hypothetical protein